MKATKILVLVLCLVFLVASFGIASFAAGASAVTPETEVTNDNGTVTTKYGTITKTYASAKDYPFAVFSSKTGFIQGYNTLKGAMDKAKAHVSSSNVWNVEEQTYGDDEVKSYVLVRANYTTSTSDKFDNFAQAQGEVIIDLNGYSITQGNGTDGIFYYVTSKGWDSGEAMVFPTTFTVINGTLLVNDKPVIYANMWNSVAEYDYSMADKHFTWNFNNKQWCWLI